MNKHRQSVLRAAVILLALTLLLPVLPAAAADGADALLVASFASPALCTDAGKTVNLADCGVQYAAGGIVVSGAEITWTVDGETVTSFTPAAAGVYPVKAKSSAGTRTVYIVAKNPGDKDYVLYSNDFSADPMADLRILQQTTGSKLTHDAAAGTLVLDSSDSGNSYIRILLPSYLDDFADAVIDARLKLSEPNGSTARWGSVMFRADKKNIPYMQACLRYDSTASNGTEISERTAADAWNVIVKGAAAQVKDTFADLHVAYAGSNSSFSVNGKQVLSLDTTPFYAGGIGFQVRGVKMTVDSVKVTVNPEASVDSGIIPGHYAQVTEVSTNISSSPIIVTEVTEREEFTALSQNPPTAAIFTLGMFGGKPGVVLGVSGGEPDTEKPENVISALDGKIIPGFRVASNEAVDALVAFVKANNLRDVYVVADDPDLIARAKAGWQYFHGVVDYSSYSGEEFETVRAAVIGCGARVVIIPAYSMTRERVKYLEDRYLSAWVFADGGKAETVAAINSGVFGIITADRAQTAACFTEFYQKNTLVLSPNIIGHRGVPSVAQENSLAGCIKAFEFGADMVENDIYLSADKVLVVMHDTTIDRTTNGQGTITGMTTKQLEKYQIITINTLPGEPIPTLEDYFKEFKGNGKAIVIELKSNNLNVAKPLADLVTKYDILDQIVVISFYPAVIQEVRKYLPGVSGAALNSSIKPDEGLVPELTAQLLELVEQYNTAYSPSYASNALGPKLVNSLFARGVTTWIWTVNKQADFDTYFVRGIRGLTTNYSQWASKYVRDLTAEVDENGKVTVTAHRYDGSTADVTASAKLVVVDNGGMEVTFENGNIVLSGDGEAKVFFNYTGTTISATKYNKVTELLTVRVKAQEETSAEAGETNENTQAPDTAAPETTGDGEKTGGCGSIAAVPALAFTLLAAAYVCGKKKSASREK